MKSEFRPTSPEDAPAASAFLQRIFGLDPSAPLVDPRHLHWKCWEPHPDWPGSRGYVMTRDSLIVAHGTVVPLSCVCGETRLKVIHVIDWAADSRAVGSGAILMKRLGQMADAVLAVGGSDMTEKVLPSLGFKTCGEVTRFVRPLKPLRRLAGQTPSVRAGAQLARSIVWSLQSPSFGLRGWTAHRIAPGQLASTDMRWPRDTTGVAIFERNADVMAYLLRCPAAPIELFSVRKDGVNRGYFLLAHAPGQVRIVDFYVDSDDPNSWRALIQLAVTEAKMNRSAAELVSLGSDPITRQTLLDCGFHARGSSALRLLPSKGVALPSGPVRFQMIDNDAAYLHENRASYWA